MNLEQIKKELYDIAQKTYDLIYSIDGIELEEKPLLTDEEKKRLKLKIKELENITGHEYYAISINTQPIHHIRFYHSWYENYYDTVTGNLKIDESNFKYNVKYRLFEDLRVK